MDHKLYACPHKQQAAAVVAVLRPAGPADPKPVQMMMLCDVAAGAERSSKLMWLQKP